jgi:hypothetical protein
MILDHFLIHYFKIISYADFMVFSAGCQCQQNEYRETNPETIIAIFIRLLINMLLKIHFPQLTITMMLLVALVCSAKAEQKSELNPDNPDQLAGQSIYAALSAGKTPSEKHPGDKKAEKAVSVNNNGMGSMIGIIHPLVQVEGKYVDNLYRLRNNLTNDFVTTVSPGLWLTMPRSRERILDIKIWNNRPGGLMTDLETGTSFQRYQSYLLVKTDISSYAAESQNNFVGYTAEGFFQYNLPVALTIEGTDQFRRSFDPFGEDGSGPEDMDKYNANIFVFSLKYHPGGLFRVQGEYSNFFLDYDEDRRDYNNRTDHGANFYLWYDYSPKTSFFINEKYVRLDFRSNEREDSDQYNTYVGLHWLPSGKTRLRLKAGYVNKSYDDDSSPIANGGIFEMDALYHFTVKTSFELMAASLLNVPNESPYNYRRDNFLKLSYKQNVTEKIMLGLSGKMGQLTYKGNQVADREDNVFKINPYLQYNMKDWLGARLGYAYEKRDSDLERYDFTTNMVSLRIQTSF